MLVNDLDMTVHTHYGGKTMSENKNSHNPNGRLAGSSGGAARPLTSTEVRILMGSFSGKRRHYYRAMCAFGLYAGFRCSTITGLTRGDVIEGGKCRSFVFLSKHRQKSGRSKRYAVAKAGMEIIQEYIDTMTPEEQVQSELPLFPSFRGGGFIPPNSSSRMITGLIRKAGITGNITSHSLRKSLARQLLEQNVSLPVISSILDHKNLQTSIRYLGNITPKADTTVQNLTF